MRKWILNKIRSYFSNTALDLSEKWGECRSIMERSVNRNEGILKYGMLGFTVAIIMSFGILGNAIDILIPIVITVFGLLAFVTWLCLLIVYPFCTLIATVALSIPFLFGCIYCVNIKNEIEKWKYDLRNC